MKFNKMTEWLHRLVVLRDVRLQWKILALTMSVILCSIIIFIVLYNQMWKAYEEQLYEEMAANLLSSTQNIETELRSLQTTLSSTATANTLQACIVNMENADSDYTRYIYRQQILSIINEMIYSYSYVLSQSYIDTKKSYITIGSDTTTNIDNNIDYYFNAAVEQNGKPLWFYHDHDVVLATEVREIENLSLRNMGVIALRVQISQIVNSTFSLSSNDSDLFIYSGDELVYHTGNSIMPLDIMSLSNDNEYWVDETSGERRFIVSMQSEYTGFSYYYSVSYSDLFSNLLEIRNVAILVCILLSSALILFSFLLSGSITKPLGHLTEMMKETPKALFQYEKPFSHKTTRYDEIGIVSDTYLHTITKLKELIQENYVKQLIIKDTQYLALQTQINPHFIYNTLDSIYWMAEKEKKHDIAMMTFSLGRLLRENIKRTDTYKRLIPLREELNILDYYINIQKIRFREKLSIIFDIKESAMDILIPRMILQPLVENSIHYSVEMLDEQGSIRIESRRKEQQLFIRVIDNGIGCPDNLLEDIREGKIKPKGSGIGLQNIYQRLQMLFEDAATLSISMLEPHGTTVEIILPITLPEEPETNV